MRIGNSEYQKGSSDIRFYIYIQSNGQDKSVTIFYCFVTVWLYVFLIKSENKINVSRTASTFRLEARLAGCGNTS